jgi:hypothetical protein
VTYDSWKTRNPADDFWSEDSREDIPDEEPSRSNGEPLWRVHWFVGVVVAWPAGQASSLLIVSFWRTFVLAVFLSRRRIEFSRCVPEPDLPY